ncbi:MAG: ABC transporter ATP-binding protein [Peptostreptococcaceae bacterium]|nr:ABC transporter ATP-binding protein [Peptostreptococcaceae bacterium]
MKNILRGLTFYKKKIVLVFLMVIGSAMSSLALPMYMSRVINVAIVNEDMGMVLRIGVQMLFFVILGLSCSIAMGYFAAHVSVGFSKSLRSRVFKKVQEFSQPEFDAISTSSLITRTNNDVMQIQTFVNIVLRISLMAPIMAVGGIVMALAKNVKMSMILLVAMPVMLLFIFNAARRIVPLSSKMQGRLDEINLVIREKLTGIRVARTFGTEAYEEERFEKVNRDFMENATKLGKIMATLMPGLNLILYGTTVALMAFAGFEIVKGSLVPVGDMIAVIQYVIQIIMSVVMMSMVFLFYPRASVSAKRIDEVLSMVPSIQNTSRELPPTEERGRVSFRSVSFTFPNANAPALENISFDSEPEEITAIIGSTGSGKSTLINLIPRFYDVQSGEILVDGVNIKDMDLNVLRGKIGLVPQKAFLFKGSIRDNIAYGTSLSDEEIHHVLQIAQSEQFVMEKEGGLDAPITQGATNLSGGQKQRLAIARAIGRKPEIYIFDDSFSALDFKTDSALRKALFRETENATVILVAQRVSTIKNADRIIVLENGKIAGIGKHTELLQNCEVYREIVYSQMSEEEAR